MLVVFWGVLVGGEVFGAGDHAAYYWPVKSIYAALARSSAGVPLWNPFLASGQPFAANPHHAVFHPLTALFLVLPFEVAYRLQVLLPIPLLSCSGFYLARSLRLPLAAAAFSAVAWGFGGATISLLQAVPGLITIAPLPGVLAFAVQLGRRGARTDVLGFGVLFGLMILGGDPGVLLMGSFLSAVALLHGHRIGDSEGVPPLPLASAFGRLFLGGLLGAALGAAMLVPGLSHARNTVRAEGLDARKAYEFTTPAVRLSELAIPDALGIHSLNGGTPSPGERLYPSRGAPFLTSLYPGLLLVAAAVTAWFPRRSPTRYWALPAVLGILLSLGAATPLFPLVRTLPIISGIRFPERFLLLTLAALAVAGTCGVARLLEGDPRTLLHVSLSGAVLLAAATALSGIGGAPSRLIGARFARQSAVLALGLGAVALASRASRGSALHVLPALALAADLAAVGRALVGSKPPAELRALPAPLVPLTKAPPRGYVFHAAAQDRLRGDLQFLASPPVLAQQGIATALDRNYDLAELVWSAHATATVLGALSALPDQAHTLLARRGIAAIVAFRPDAPRSAREARLRPPSELLSLLAVPRPQPLCFAADSLVAGAGEAGWRAAVSTAGPAARSLAVVDPADIPWPMPARVSPARVDVVSRDASRLVLRVEGAGPDVSFIALNQTWDSGWEARLDGTPVPLVRTDLSLSGLLVPAGRHEVILNYRSLPVSIGVGLSLGALVATGIAYRAGRRRTA